MTFRLNQEVDFLEYKHCKTSNINRLFESPIFTAAVYVLRLNKLKPTTYNKISTNKLQIIPAMYVFST